MKKIALLAIATIVLSFRFTKTSAQTITTFAGSDSSGYSGDGGAATLARLGSPRGIAIDNMGSIYFTDFYCHCVRKINTSGVINTIAGNGSPGYSGDGGAATAATLYSPSSVAIDDSGNIYIADESYNCVRRINTAGIITLFAGNTSPGYGGDGGSATAAQLESPVGVAVDHTGNVYIADMANHAIRKVSGGNISTFAGTGVGGQSSDGSPATASRIGKPISIAIDALGNVFFSDSLSFVHKVDISGIITTIAGYGPYGYFGDGGPATAARFNSINGTAIGMSGEIYLSDAGNSVVRVINHTGIINNYAGSHVQGYGGDGGPAWLCEFNGPSGISMDATGCVYVADAANARIRKISATTAVSNVDFPGALRCYPNPSSGSFTITLPQAVEPTATVAITNTLGQTIYTNTFTTNRPAQINLAAPSGIYFITATVGSKQAKTKIVIE